MVDSSWSMTRVIHMAIESWLDDLESREDKVISADGYPIIKPAGMPYPKRPSDALRQGQARKGERKSLTQRADGEWSATTTRLSIPAYERLQDAVFWRDTLRSHDIEQALVDWFKKNLSGNKAL